MRLEFLSILQYGPMGSVSQTRHFEIGYLPRFPLYVIQQLAGGRLESLKGCGVATQNLFSSVPFPVGVGILRAPETTVEIVKRVEEFG